VLADSYGSDVGLNLSGDLAVSTALQGHEYAHTLGDVMTAAVPLRKEGRLAGAVSLSQPLRDVAAVLADLRIRLALSPSCRSCSRRSSGWCWREPSPALSVS